VEITNDPWFFRRASPGTEVPLKYETGPRLMEALPVPWLCNIAPVGTPRIVIVGAAAVGVIVRGVPAAWPNAARLASNNNIHTMYFLFIDPNWLDACCRPASIPRFTVCGQN
jgi:hypothetical protein